VIIEKRSGGVVVGSTAVDFFIRIGEATGNQPPAFTAPTPADGTVLNAAVGDPISFDVAAGDPDAGDTVTLSVLGVPSGATFASTPGNPATGTFSWTPGATGTVLLTLNAQDQFGLGATQRSVTIVVTDDDPGPIDDTAPSCELTAMYKGPPAAIEVTTWDDGSGIADIEVTKATSLTVAFDPDPFTVGTNDPVQVIATKIDNSKRAQLELRVTDVDGNVTVCDPVHTLEVRSAGKPTTNTFGEIPEEEGTITIQNNTPGVQRIDVEVNGQLWRVTGLKNGEERTLDVSSAMVAGNDNVVALTVHGRPGGTVDVWIWDGVS
jgi:hypothetical protein